MSAWMRSVLLGKNMGERKTLTGEMRRLTNNSRTHTEQGQDNLAQLNSKRLTPRRTNISSYKMHQVKLLLTAFPSYQTMYASKKLANRHKPLSSQMCFWRNAGSNHLPFMPTSFCLFHQHMKPRRNPRLCNTAPYHSIQHGKFNLPLSHSGTDDVTRPDAALYSIRIASTLAPQNPGAQFRQRRQEAPTSPNHSTCMHICHL